MLSDYEPFVGFRPAKNPDFWDPTLPFVDEVAMPVISEYAQAIAQLKAGNILTYLQSRGEDVLRDHTREHPTSMDYQNIHVRRKLIARRLESSCRKNPAKTHDCAPPASLGYRQSAPLALE